MAYDVAVADRVRALLPPDLPMLEKPMFGGLAFLADGRMCAGVLGHRIILWLGREGAARGLNIRWPRRWTSPAGSCAP